MSELAEPVRRSKNGCQQCRQRKKKCDERHPHCTACSERNLPCNWEREMPGRRRRMARRHENGNRNFTVPQEVRSLVTIFTVPSTPIKDRLLSHFCATSPLWLTVGGDERGTTCQQLIMAGVQRSPLVLDCVLAVAAGDLSKYQPASSDMTSLTHGFYGQAVIGIRSVLSKEFSQSEPEASKPCGDDDVLLAILLLCVHETVNFSNAARILPHINAAATLCYNRSFSTAADSNLRGLLFEMFCYFFTLTAFSYGQHLDLELALQVFDSPFLTPNTYQGVLLGRRCREIFSYTHVVNILLKKAGPRHTPNSSETSQLKSIEARLETLSIDPEIDQIDQDQEITTQLYRIACSIYVKRALNPELTHRSVRIQELVAQFITYLNMLPAMSDSNGILCRPLVVAGLSSTIGTHQRLIIGRLRKIHERWRSDILTLSADMLSKVWREARVSDSLGNEDSVDDSCCNLGVRTLAIMTETVKKPILLI